MECTPFVWEVAWFYSGRILFLAEILSGFSLPLLHFPQWEEIPGNPAQSGSEVSSVFPSCFSATYPIKTREKFDFQRGLWGTLSCWICWTTQFVPSFDLCAACPRISHPGYQENQLQEKHPPLHERFGQKLGMQEEILGCWVSDQWRSSSLKPGSWTSSQHLMLFHRFCCFPCCFSLCILWGYDGYPKGTEMLPLEKCSWSCWKSHLCVDELRALRAAGCWKDPPGSALSWSSPKSRRKSFWQGWIRDNFFGFSVLWDRILLPSQ